MVECVLGQLKPSELLYLIAYVGTAVAKFGPFDFTVRRYQLIVKL